MYGPPSFSPTLVWLIVIHCPCWSRVGGQSGIHYQVCVCLHALKVNQSLSWGVNAFGREKHLGCESWRVCHFECTFSTVCESRCCICASFHSLSPWVQIRWEEIRGDRRSLGSRSEAHLMPVCINAVWHLSAPYMHTLWHADIRWQRVCEWVKSGSVWQSFQLTDRFFFLHSRASWYARLIPFAEAAKLWGVFISTVSSHASFLVPPSSCCHYSWKPSRVRIVNDVWLPFLARTFLEKGPRGCWVNPQHWAWWLVLVSIRRLCLKFGENWLLDLPRRRSTALRWVRSLIHRCVSVCRTFVLASQSASASGGALLMPRLHVLITPASNM